MPNPYALKYSAKSRAKATARDQAKALRRAKSHYTQANHLHRAIVQLYRHDIAPSLNLPFLGLIPVLVQRPGRSWAGHRQDRRLGMVEGSPPLLIPISSQDQAHPCLWIVPLHPEARISARRSLIFKQLRDMGHALALVQSVDQAKASILAYLVGADPGARPGPG